MNRLYYTEKVKPNQCISTLTSIYCASTGEILHIPRQVRNQTTKTARPRTHTTTNLCYYPTNASLFFAEMWLLKAPPWRSPTGTWTRSQIWLSSCRPRLESRFCGSPATCLPTRGDLCLTAAERERRLSFLNPNINCWSANVVQVHERCGHQPRLPRLGLRRRPAEEGAGRGQKAGRRELR